MNTSFTLSILGLLILAGMAYKGTDTSGALVTLISAYIVSESSRKASHIWAASKDKDCNTQNSIEVIEDKK